MAKIQPTWGEVEGGRVSYTLSMGRNHRRH